MRILELQQRMAISLGELSKHLFALSMDSFYFDHPSIFRLRRNAEWEACIPVADHSWKQIAEPVMKLYTETTDGSTIDNKETALVWNYEDADPDFGSCQAKELLDHLESVLVNEPVSVKSGTNIVEVKPQVSNM